MMKYLFLFCAFHLLLNANEAEKILGLTGTYNDNVFTITVPRAKVKVNVSGMVIDPFMGLTSWVAFSPASENQSQVMGDLVLFQDEVNPVMSALLSSNLEITALHNHFFYDNPKVYFMHFQGTGPVADLAKGVKKWIDTVKEIRTKHPAPALSFGAHPVSAKSIISRMPLEAIFGTKGEEKNGMVKFTFGKIETGMRSFVAFAGTNDNALADGDFAVSENDLQETLKTLRKGNINIVAIHNHMTNESPRTIFVHFWANGRADVLAKTFKDVLKR